MKTKTLLLFFLAGLTIARAQITSSVSATEGGMPETLGISFTAEAVSSLNACVLAKPAQIALLATVGASIGSGDTTFTLSDTTGLVAGMGLVIDSEASLVTSVTSSTVVAVVRGTLGTTAVTHAIAAPVSVLANGNILGFVKTLISISVRQLMQNTPGPIIAGNQSSTSTQLSGAVY